MQLQLDTVLVRLFTIALKAPVDVLAALLCQMSSVSVRTCLGVTKL